VYKRQALDIGSNIGVHTVEWSKYMHGWGHVFSFEAQEWIFYALAGNIAINNCYNAKAFNVAVGESNGEIDIPVPDYFSPGSFGSLELQKTISNENIGQSIDYSKTVPVRLVSIDSLSLGRIDLIKIDVEGMELDVLRGGKESIEKFRPLLFIEKIKTNEQHLRALLESWKYVSFEIGMNILSIPFENDLSKKIVVQV
jgi:FkbM family methyltransferase